MLSDRAFAVSGLTALVAVGLVATPAISAIGADAEHRAAALSALVGRFTPATGDPVLLARYARVSEESRRNFRFTPALPRSENRSVTLVVRARTRPVPVALVTSVLRDSRRDQREAVQPVAIAPVSYSLGAAVGYSAFTTNVRGDAVDIAALPAARRPAEAASPRRSRLSADMRLENRSLSGGETRPLEADRAMSVDVTGSYRLSRNLDVTAGLRLQRENDRLQPITDQRQDSQAVYVGTQFRF